MTRSIALVRTATSLSLVRDDLSMKFSAPSLVAFTAVSMVPLPEIMMIGIDGYSRMDLPSTSIPVIEDSLPNSMSSNMRPTSRLLVSRKLSACSGLLRISAFHPSPRTTSARVAQKSRLSSTMRIFMVFNRGESASSAGHRVRACHGSGMSPDPGSIRPVNIRQSGRCGIRCIWPLFRARSKPAS